MFRLLRFYHTYICFFFNFYIVGEDYILEGSHPSLPYTDFPPSTYPYSMPSYSTTHSSDSDFSHQQYASESPFLFHRTNNTPPPMQGPPSSPAHFTVGQRDFDMELNSVPSGGTLSGETLRPSMKRTMRSRHSEGQASPLASGQAFRPQNPASWNVTMTLPSPESSPPLVPRHYIRNNWTQSSVESVISSK